MKKNLLIMVALVAGVCVMTSCGGGTNKTVIAQAPQTTVSYQAPVGNTFDVPLAKEDDENYWYGLGMATGSKSQMRELRRIALKDAKTDLGDRLETFYESVFSDFVDKIGNNSGNDLSSHLRNTADQVTKGIIGRLDSETEKWTEDGKGNVTCFRRVKLSRKEVADKITQAVSDDEYYKTRFKEDEFKKYADEKIKQYYNK